MMSIARIAGRIITYREYRHRLLVFEIWDFSSGINKLVY